VISATVRRCNGQTRGRTDRQTDGQTACCGVRRWMGRAARPGAVRCIDFRAGS